MSQPDRLTPEQIRHLHTRIINGRSINGDQLDALCDMAIRSLDAGDDHIQSKLRAAVRAAFEHGVCVKARFTTRGDKWRITHKEAIQTALDLGQINAAPQDASTRKDEDGTVDVDSPLNRVESATSPTATPSGAAPDVRELLREWRYELNHALLTGPNVNDFVSRKLEARIAEIDAALRAQPAAAKEELLDIPSFLRKWPDEKPAAAGVSEERMPNPTDADIADPLFEAIWQVTKRWDVNAPEYYVGYCGMNGSHVLLILNAIRHSLARGEQGEEK